MSRGTMLPTTDTTPRPPMLISGSVRLSSPLRMRQVAQRRDVRRLVQRAGRFLDGHDGRNLGQAGDGFGQDVRAGAAGNVVKDDGQVAGLGDGGEVAVVAFLGRLVVIRPDHEGAVGPGLLGEARQADRLAGAVGAGAGHDLDAAARLLDHGGDDALVLLVVERRRFAGGADRGQAVGALLDVPVDQPAQGREIDFARRGTA